LADDFGAAGAFLGLAALAAGLFFAGFFDVLATACS
jgi:hypothetical protein